MSWKKIKIKFSLRTFPTCCKYRKTNGIWEAILFYCFRIRSFKPNTHSFICPNAHPTIYLCSFNWIIGSISTSLAMFLFLKQTVPNIWWKKKPLLFFHSHTAMSIKWVLETTTLTSRLSWVLESWTVLLECRQPPSHLLAGQTSKL